MLYFCQWMFEVRILHYFTLRVLHIQHIAYTMNEKAKENANPKIIAVTKGSSKGRPATDIWSSINRMGQTDDHDLSGSYSHNLSILKALQDTSDATHGRSVSLLENSGLMLRQDDSATTHKSTFHFPVQLSAFATSFEGSQSQGNCKRMYREAIDEDEVFDIIRNIQDPEHPLTLEQLGVVSRQQIEVKEIPFGLSYADVRFTPTIPHCSMATLIGLSIRVKLLRSLPSRFKVTVRIEPGTHNSELAVNKQLADKERVCAALENKHLLGLVDKCIKSGMGLSG